MVAEVAEAVRVPVLALVPGVAEQAAARRIHMKTKGKTSVVRVIYDF